MFSILHEWGQTSLCQKVSNEIFYQIDMVCNHTSIFRKGVSILRNFVIEGVACQLLEDTASHSSITNFLSKHVLVLISVVSQKQQTIFRNHKSPTYLSIKKMSYS